MQQGASTQELLPADRERACKYYGYDDEKELAYWGNISSHRDVERLAEAFAAHRIEHTPSDRNAVLALGTTLDVVDELYRKYEVELDAADILTVRRARDAHQSALTTTPEPTEPAGVAGLADELERLAEKAFSPNARDWYVPWRVVPSDGKPIIAGSNSGNLFRGFIGTWQDADLVVALVNNLPAIIAALSRTPPLLEGLFEAIQHGDADHRAWLREAIDAYAAGKPVPEPRGKGRKEALLEVAKEALEPFAEAADNLTGDEPDQGSLWESPEAMMLEYRHLRNARAALQAIKGAEQ